MNHTNSRNYLRGGSNEGEEINDLRAKNITLKKEWDNCLDQYIKLDDELKQTKVELRKLLEMPVE